MQRYTRGWTNDIWSLGSDDDANQCVPMTSAALAGVSMGSRLYVAGARAPLENVECLLYMMSRDVFQ